MLSDPAVHVTVTKAVALSIKAILFAFTDYNAEIFAVVANTPGYISMVMSCWTDQAKNFDPSYGFDEYDPWLLLPLLSDPQRTQEINDFCGGTIQFVGMCLDRIITNIGQTVPDHDALRGDLSLFSLSDPLKHPIWPAFLSHTRCIEVIIRVLLYSMQRPKERFPLLVPCLAILSIALSIGGYVFALRVLQTEYLPLLIRAATAYEKSPDIMREQPEMAQNFARSLTNSLSLYLINRTCCSAIRSSLRTPTFRRAASKLDPRGAFAQALGAFEGRVQAWKSVALEYKIRPRTVFKCGNPNVRVAYEYCCKTQLIADRSATSLTIMNKKNSYAAQAVFVLDIAPGMYILFLAIRGSTQFILQVVSKTGLERAPSRTMSRHAKIDL